jgi:type VI secretion system secreted protein VgrG
MLNAGGEADLSVVKRLFVGVGQGLSLFVRKLGLKLIANQGPVTVQAQNDKLELMARHGLDITSTEDEIRIVAKKKITLNAGGSYITLDEGVIESGTLGDFVVRSANFEYVKGAASMKAAHPDYPQRLFKQPLRLRMPQTPNGSGQGWVGMPYTLKADGVPVQQGVLDGSGQLLLDHQVVTQRYQLTLANGMTYQLPVPTEYRNAEQAHLANGGLHNHPSQTDSEVNTPSAHTDHRALYAVQMGGPDHNKEETNP